MAAHKINAREMRKYYGDMGYRVTHDRVLAYEKKFGKITHMHCNCCHYEKKIESFPFKETAAMRKGSMCDECEKAKSKARAQRWREKNKTKVQPMNAYGCRYPVPTEGADDPKTRNEAWAKAYKAGAGNIGYNGLPLNHKPKPKPIHGPGPWFTQ